MLNMAAVTVKSTNSLLRIAMQLKEPIIFFIYSTMHISTIYDTIVVKLLI